MRNCFVPWCDSICKDQPRRCMFHPPKNMYEIWKATLPKQKEFKPTDKVCERHFHKSDVIRNFEQIINGEIFRLERGRPRLKPNAIPCLNLPAEEDVLPKSRRGRHPKWTNETKSPTNKRKRSDTKETSPTSSSPSSPTTKKENKVNNSKSCSKNKDTMYEFEVTKCNIERLENCEEREIIDDIYLDETLLQSQYDALYDDIFEVVLPNTLWGIHRDPNRKYIAITYFDCDALQTTKTITFNNKGELKIFIYNRLLTEESTTEMSYEVLSLVVNQIDELRICKNAKTSNSNNSDNIFYDKCELKIEDSNDNNSDTDLCNECKKLL